jgi:CubicO group peptidase (beta-lactamase class C family)
MIRLSLYLTTFLSLSTALTGRGELPQAKPEDVGMSAEKLSRVVPVMQKFVDEKKVAGAVTIVTKNGKIVLCEAVGQQDIDADQPMRVDSIFRIYSMTKPITSVAAMILVEEGKLGLDDPVSKHLPEFKDLKVFAGVKDGELQLEDPKSEATVRDLLRHTSGLTYGFFGNTEVDQRYRSADVLSPKGTIADTVTKLGKLPLLYQPGTRFNYSVSTDVLGRLVEVASGKKFDEFLEDKIFTPLQMSDTGFYVPPEKIGRFAVNYGPTTDEGLRVVDLPKDSSFSRKPTFLSGGGGLVSTAGDYIRFCQMLLNKGELEGKRLLRAESVEVMTRNQLPDSAYPLELNGKREGVGFGLGFSVVVEKTAYTSVNQVGEYGWGGAASTHFWISPQDNLAVVALTQLMPFTFQMEHAVKPVIYEAIVPPLQGPSLKCGKD